MVHFKENSIGAKINHVSFSAFCVIQCRVRKNLMGLNYNIGGNVSLWWH